MIVMGRLFIRYMGRNRSVKGKVAISEKWPFFLVSLSVVTNLFRYHP